MWNEDRSIWKGAVAGAAGGLAAAWVMNQFQTGWSKASEKLQPYKTPQGEQERQSQADEEDATMKTAGKISESVFHRKLSKEDKKKLGPVVHYAFGTSVGSLYGALAEFEPRTTSGFGLPY